jgi:serine/threonine-protein kinase RsbW
MRFELRLPSRTDCLHLIRSFVATVADRAGLPPDGIDQVELAVDEACANVMLHAHARNPHKQVCVVLHIEPQKLIIGVTDEGQPFDPTSIPAPDLEAYLSAHRVGGLGIYLIRRLMDEVQYCRSPDGKNELRMVKYLGSAARRP